MAAVRDPHEVLLVRQVFETWSVCIPHGFEETFVREGAYWHAWDATRSISMSSTRIALPDGTPVPAAAIVEQCGPMISGGMLDDLPAGLVGVAAMIDSGGTDSRASHAICTLLAADGYAMIATVTADDLEWATRTYLSIQFRRDEASRSASDRLATVGRGASPPRATRRGWDRGAH